jgi:hypothetical protein
MSKLTDLAASIDTRVALVFLLLAIDIWVIGMTLASNGSRREKVLWSAIVILCPIIGCLFWFSLGPKPDLIGGVKARMSKQREVH